MFEGFILGAIQGITEWLPISSEGALVLAQQAMGDGGDLSDMISVALFLHLGTFFAALVYFWDDVVLLSKTLFSFKSADNSARKLLTFLIIATFISGMFGASLLFAVSEKFDEFAKTSGVAITIAIGALLLLTAILQLRASQSGAKDQSSLSTKDGVILGFAEGLSALPGISRSGITVSMFLLKGFEKKSALRLSFLMSMPIVLGGNIVLGLSDATISVSSLWGLLFSFIFGLLTIKALFAVAERINFGWFVFAFGILTIFSVFL